MKEAGSEWEDDDVRRLVSDGYGGRAAPAIFHHSVCGDDFPFAGTPVEVKKNTDEDW